MGDRVTLESVGVAVRCLHVGVDVVCCPLQGAHLVRLTVWKLNGAQVALGVGDVMVGRYKTVTALCSYRVTYLDVAGETNASF